MINSIRDNYIPLEEESASPASSVLRFTTTRLPSLPCAFSSTATVTMKFLSILALIAPVAFALPTSVITEAPVEDAALEARQSCYVKCGSTCYTSAQVSSARNAAYNYVKQGSTAGGSTYPHKYNNYEGFDFLVSGTYYEFPLKTSGVYTGGMYI